MATIRKMPYENSMFYETRNGLRMECAYSGRYYELITLPIWRLSDARSLEYRGSQGSQHRFRCGFGPRICRVFSVKSTRTWDRAIVANGEKGWRIYRGKRMEDTGEVVCGRLNFIGHGNRSRICRSVAETAELKRHVHGNAAPPGLLLPPPSLFIFFPSACFFPTPSPFLSFYFYLTPRHWLLFCCRSTLRFNDLVACSPFGNSLPTRDCKHKNFIGELFTFLNYYAS